ncbi:head-tail connector protein [Alicyclobacillus dauci]|uniref:Head-tail connector protein n=1 Tax=Alicyclobacillus dauci TaxID=1475485 RepID=A0ABY6Z951_9BACL|nr:head-tail connector protein [Alicyclobacillus dauci]WAH38615.1 head-tail connector protein [Alicyclobacillus dauci]
MILNVVEEPAQEPLTVTDAKLYLRVDDDTEDDMISAFITAAREWCEAYQNRAYITQTLELVIDHFPHHISEPFLFYDLPFLFSGERELYRHRHRHHNEIRLPMPPIQSVTSVAYTDETGAKTTVDPSTYIVDADSEPGRIVPASGQKWPLVRLQPINGVRVQYVAGYGTADKVPKSVLQAMKMLIDHWYNNRSAVGSVGGEVAFAVKSLLAKQRIVNT